MVVDEAGSGGTYLGRESFRQPGWVQGILAARASRAEAKSETLGKMIRMALAGASAAEVRGMAEMAPAE